MHHEHTGNCCQPIDQHAHLHEHHEHHHAALPLGHICTGACLHEAAEVQALAALQAEHAMIEHLQTGQLAENEGTANNAKKRKGSKRRRLGTSWLTTLMQAA